MLVLDKESSKQGTIYGQNVGSGTSMLERKLQRQRLREGKEQGAWGEDKRSSVALRPNPGGDGDGGRGRV